MSSEERNDANFIDVPFLDVKVTPMTAEEAARWVTKQTHKSLIANHNLHSVYLYHTDENFARFYSLADKIVVDGAPILWFAKSRKKVLNSTHRIGSTDWLAQLGSASPERRMLIYGATQESNASCVAALRGQLGESGWSVDGLDGYVDTKVAVDWIRRENPSLVLVGLGMPMQEQFIYDNWDSLPPAVYANVGGAIDYIGGTSKLAPRWLGVVGLEWLWRLLHAPRRLAARYLVEPLKLVLLLTRRSLNSRVRPSKGDW